MFAEESTLELDNTNIPEVEKLLTAHGIAYTESGGVLRHELKVFDILYGVVCVISAENLIHAKDIDIALRRIQYRIFEEELELPSRPTLYLFVVWDGRKDRDRQYIEARWKLEQNLGAARKLVMQPTDVITWLQNPFSLREMGRRANGVPSLTTMRLVDFPAQKVAPVAEMLQTEAILKSISQDCMEPEFVRLQPLVSHLYRRVMGSAQKVFWTEEGPALAQVYDERGLPLDWCSSGERAMFAFCVFMARSSVNMTPNLCIGFPGTFSGIDDLRQIAAFDCLRDLVAATGISVVVQAPQNDRRARVISRVRPIVEALGGQVVDRGIDFG